LLKLGAEPGACQPQRAPYTELTAVRIGVACLVAGADSLRSLGRAKARPYMALTEGTCI